MPIAPDVVLGTDVKIVHPTLVNLYGCRIGDDSKIGTFVEIQKNAVIGRRCKISSHTFICEGVTIEDDVFWGHCVMCINDRDPWVTVDGRLQPEEDSTVVPTIICRGSLLGCSAVILCGVTIGENAMIGVAAVAARDVAPG